MSQTADSVYEELIITNYDPRKWSVMVSNLLFSVWGGRGNERIIS